MDRMRPANETCEQCHFRGHSKDDDTLKVIRHYDNDEQSTEKLTILLMRVAKIHAAHLEREIEFVAPVADPQEIPAVMSSGKAYAVEGSATMSPTRKMDCMDCHNRTGHDFETPESAVDRSIATGKLDRSHPFARRDAVAALKAQSGLAAQPAAVQLMHTTNVYPKLNIGWGTYPNNIGHDRFPGCFRCHDDQHKTKSGDTITQDCGACHELVAVDEQNPKILKDLGLQ
jgi:hypothetical protein